MFTFDKLWTFMKQFLSILTFKSTTWFENISKKEEVKMQIDVDENVFKVYAISIAVLMAKTLIMALLTARQRFKTMVGT